MTNPYSDLSSERPNSGRTLVDDHRKTFITEANLIAFIDKVELAGIRHFRVRTETGRWTAIFYGPDATEAIFNGFLLVG